MKSRADLRGIRLPLPIYSQAEELRDELDLSWRQLILICLKVVLVNRAKLPLDVMATDIRARYPATPGRPRKEVAEDAGSE